MVDSFIEHFLPAICFGYPFVMAWYWMSGGLLYRWIRGRHEPLYDAPVALVEYPSVSILVPCHNEEARFVRRFQGDARIGGVTGNPRIRNRASLLGLLQVGEFSSIIGLIKRAQTVYGGLFTVSGVMCAFRKRALHEAG
jgi:cellulose synthase/poly-beta-1,6-N-acetylglucosamine synthase-like glycosyltransferase